MKKGGGKRKGNALERRISKELSLWWTNGKHDDIFWRSASSGGRATQRAKSGKHTSGSYGDITAVDHIGDPLLKFFCIELKKGYTKDIDVLDLIDGKKKVPTIVKFWKQVEKATKEANALTSLLIFERNRKNTSIVIKRKWIAELENYAGEFNGNSIVINHNRIPFLVICKLSDFTNWVKDDDIISCLKDYK